MNCNKHFFHFCCCYYFFSLLLCLRCELAAYSLTRFQRIYLKMYLFNVVAIVVIFCCYVFVFLVYEISDESVCRVFIQSTCSLLTLTLTFHRFVAHVCVGAAAAAAVIFCCCLCCELMNHTHTQCLIHIYVLT